MSHSLKDSRIWTNGLICGLLTYSIMYLFISYYEYHISMIAVFLISIALGFVFEFISLIKFKIIIYLVMFLIVGYFIYDLIKKNYIMIYMVDNTLIQFIDGSYFVKDEYFYELLIINISAFLYGFFMHICIKYQLTRTLLMGVVATGLAIIGSHDILIQDIVLWIWISYFLFALMEFYSCLRIKKVSYEYNQKINYSLFPICMLISFLAILLPSSEKPMEWKRVKAFIYDIEDTFQKVTDSWNNMGDGFFGKNYVGFSEEDTELGGPLSQNDTIVMEVVKNDRNSVLYLTGIIKDVYTGHSWTKSDVDIEEKSLDEKTFEYLELRFSVENHYRYMKIHMLDGQSKHLEEFGLAEKNRLADYSKLVNPVWVNVIYRNSGFKTLFYALKTYWIETDRGDIYNAEGPNLFFDKKKKNGTKYDLYFYELNLNSEDMEKFVEFYDGYSHRDAKPIDEETQKHITREIWSEENYSRDLQNEEFYLKLEDRAREIYNKYTALPMSIPDRVHQLAREITKNSTTSYDKAKAIEEYFSDRSYTLNPTQTPKGEDFVDYFLFEQEDGYCTYFATAMTVLCRSIGLPTRYVEGFVVQEDDVSGDYYQVRGRYAHSWPEVYFEGVGWIPFEPTVGMTQIRYESWTEEPSEESTTNSQGADNTQPTFPSTSSEAGDDGKTTFEDGKDDAEDKGIEILYKNIPWIFMGIGCMTLIIIIVILSKLIYKRIKYTKANINDKAIILFSQILKYYKKIGLVREPSETLLEFSERIYKSQKVSNIHIDTINNLYMKIIYGEILITQEELDLMVDFRKGLKEEI